MCYQERKLAHRNHQKNKIVRATYTTRSPGKSIPGACKQLQIPCSTIHTVFITVFGFMHITCSYCTPLDQKISRDEKSFEHAGQAGLRL